MSEADAIEELRLYAGSQFAPAVVEAFVAERRASGRRQRRSLVSPETRCATAPAVSAARA